MLVWIVNRIPTSRASDWLRWHAPWIDYNRIFRIIEPIALSHELSISHLMRIVKTIDILSIFKGIWPAAASTTPKLSEWFLPFSSCRQKTPQIRLVITFAGISQATWDCEKSDDIRGESTDFLERILEIDFLQIIPFSLLRNCHRQDHTCLYFIRKAIKCMLYILRNKSRLWSSMYRFYFHGYHNQEWILDNM